MLLKNKIQFYLDSKFYSRASKREVRKDQILSDISIPAGTCIRLQDLTSFQYNNGTVESSIFCNLIEQNCMATYYFDKSNTILISDNSLDSLLKSINEVSKDLYLNNIEEYTKLAKDSVTFFKNKQVVVAPTGIQGKLHQVGQMAQVGSAMYLTFTASTISAMTGIVGKAAISAQPMLLVAVPTIGGVFLHGAAVVVGDNFMGASCKTVGNILLLPMRGTELVLNNIILYPIGRLTGIPMILNMTSTINGGPGLTMNEAVKFKEIVEKGWLSPVWKKIGETIRIWRA